MLDLRILIADDEPDLLKWCTFALQDELGAEVVTVLDGGAAVETFGAAKAAGRPFDAVILDERMNAMGGSEAAKLMRSGADDYCKSVPIVLFTALNAGWVNGHAALFTQIWQKPMAYQEVAKKVRELLRQGDRNNVSEF